MGINMADPVGLEPTVGGLKTLIFTITVNKIYTDK